MGGLTVVIPQERAKRASVGTYCRCDYSWLLSRDSRSRHSLSLVRDDSVMIVIPQERAQRALTLVIPQERAQRALTLVIPQERAQRASVGTYCRGDYSWLLSRDSRSRHSLSLVRDDSVMIVIPQERAQRASVGTHCRGDYSWLLSRDSRSRHSLSLVRDDNESGARHSLDST